MRTALGLLSEVSLHKREAQRTERLRICAPPTFSRQILVRHLVDFSALHPGVELERLLSVPFLDMNPPDTDLAIRFGRGAFAGMAAELLIDEPVFPVCAPGLSRQIQEPARAARPGAHRSAALPDRYRSPQPKKRAVRISQWRARWDEAGHWSEPIRKSIPSPLPTDPSHIR